MDAFREAGMDPVGIEMSESFIAYLRSNQHACFGSMEELRAMKPSHRFDLIVHFFVLEHIRDTRQFLADQLAVLADDGVIIAEVPCVNDPLTSLYAIPAFERFYWSIAHHYYFSPRSIARVLDTIDCHYAIVPEQRYDLSNHLVWMQHEQPGGQGRYNDVFSSVTLESYRQDLMRHWRCDTFFLYVWKRGATRQASRVWDSPAVCGQGAAPPIRHAQPTGGAS